MDKQEREWVADRPIHLRAQLGSFHRGGGDPTLRWLPDGSFVRAVITPEGPATLHLVALDAGRRVSAAAWGPGAEWLLESVPPLLGAHDDVSDFVAHHPRVAEAHRRFPHWRVPKSGLVLDALVPAIIEQKVTGVEAFFGYRTLVRRFGAIAPGPFEGLMVPPSARGWAMIPSWAFLQASVDGARSKAVVAAARVAGRLEEGARMPLSEARARLRAVPGVGIWTAAEVAQRALGDPDSPSFGDFHVAKDIGWALTGEPVDDLGMAELLEPYRGHRYRVQHLLGLTGQHRPRVTSRMPLRTHLPRNPR